MGQLDKGNGSYVDLYWITDGRGRQYGVGDADGVDYLTLNDYINTGKHAGGVTNPWSFAPGLTRDEIRDIPWRYR
ncbi:MAG: hypothetical protein ACE5HV_17630 [Acidobacteriota bacterium]